MKYIFKFLFIFFATMSSLGLAAQSIDADVYVKLLPTSTFYDTIYSQYAPNIVSTDINFSAEWAKIADKTYKITIVLTTTTYIGKGKVIIQYTEGLPPKPKYISYHLNSIVSKISAMPDFITVFGSNSVAIYPLSNDNSTTTGLTLDGIGQIQYGNATAAGDSITYTPNGEELLDYIVYSVTDSLGSKASS
ncbi:MAG: hypothetical protein IPO92_08605 [Saprospiraceae bacterium]|nr:hypothetical protein [Saprospiraceae bacterium]